MAARRGSGVIAPTGKETTPKVRAPRETATGQCLCGAVELEIDVPVFWAWHDHTKASRLAHGAVYATYVGAWRSKVRVTRGQDSITRFVDKTHGGARSFCAQCGSPLIYERSRAPKMVNLPRALFSERTGREPRYHIGIDQFQDWAYTGQTVAPLKGYPGVVQERPKKKRAAPNSLFEA